MCILFIAINQHQDYPLIIAANRDEFRARPTKEAHWWKDIAILAGQDLQAGGTWLGVNEQGKFAAITNIRSLEKQKSEARSRGDLVIRSLDSKRGSILEYLQQQSDQYNPFNLVFQQDNDLYCFNSQSKTASKLTDGFHAICNGNINDKWPKMAKGEQQLEQLISAQDTLTAEQLFELMMDQSQAPDQLLPQTGVSLMWERLLSSIFIKDETYGTRSTSLLLKDVNNNLQFFEQSYHSDGSIFNSQQFSF